MSFVPQDFTVWIEIPVRDITAAQTFYETVLQTEMRYDDSGPNPMAVFQTADPSGVAGHLYPGTPAAAGTGNTVHLRCPDTLEAATDRVKAAGGTVVSPPISIPPGRFAYFLDPDGNSIGIFELAA